MSFHAMLAAGGTWMHPMPSPLTRLLAGGLVCALLSGCAGHRDGPVAVEDSENYRGPVGAALAPVVDRTRTPLGASGTEAIAREIETTLVGARIVAAVIRPNGHDDGHDGAVLIAPTLLKASWQGGAGEVEIQVRASDTSTGAVTLDRRYVGACGACPFGAGAGTITGPLAVALKDLTSDLAARYGAH
jgi:hypothetical protein